MLEKIADSKYQSGLETADGSFCDAQQQLLAITIWALEPSSNQLLHVDAENRSKSKVHHRIILHSVQN